MSARHGVANINIVRHVRTDACALPRKYIIFDGKRNVKVTIFVTIIIIIVQITSLFFFFSIYFMIAIYFSFRRGKSPDKVNVAAAVAASSVLLPRSPVQTIYRRTHILYTLFGFINMAGRDRLRSNSRSSH